MIKRFRLIFPLVTVMAVVGATEARAVSITFQGAVDISGSGKGNVLGLLSLADNGRGNGNPEVGSSQWNGTTATFTGDTTDEQHFFSRSVSELASVPITNSFGLIFQVNENGPDHALDLSSVAVNFFAANGSSLFSGLYSGPSLHLEGGGQGSSGWLFNVTLTDAERILFFANANNHVGVAANIGDAGAGSDNFFAITGAGGNVGITATPEPASLVLLGSGLAFATFRMRRKR